MPLRRMACRPGTSVPVLAPRGIPGKAMRPTPTKPPDGILASRCAAPERSRHRPADRDECPGADLACSMVPALADARAFGHWNAGSAHHCCVQALPQSGLAAPDRPRAHPRAPPAPVAELTAEGGPAPPPFPLGSPVRLGRIRPSFRRVVRASKASRGHRETTNNKGHALP